MPSYAAFLSYSHRADSKLAAALHHALERLGTPWWRRAALRIFRDDASLAASAALWPALQQNLEASEHLILLASPEGAQSPWVAQELAWWLQNRPRHRLLIVVTGGDLVYDRHARDFDWTRTTCLSHALRGVFDAEPLWTDLRAVAGAGRPTLRDSRFRGAALALAAALRGVSKDELENADLRQHRRSLAAAGAVAALVLALGGLATWALSAVREESAAARTARQQAESRRLAAEAQAQLDGGRGVERATLKAALAWRLAPTDEARKALQRIDRETTDVARVLQQHTGDVRHIAFNRDGSELLSASTDGLVLRWRLDTGRATGAPMVAEPMEPRRLVVSVDGSHVLVAGSRDATGQAVIALFRAADGTRRPLGLALTKDVAEPACAAVSPSGQRVAVGGRGMVEVGEVASATTRVHAAPGGAHVHAAVFSGEDALLLLLQDVYGQTLRAARLALPQGHWTLGPPRALRSTGCGWAVLSADTQQAVVRSDSDSRLVHLRVEPGLTLRPAGPALDARMIELYGHYAPALDAAGRRLAWGNQGTGQVVDLEDARPLKTTQRVAGGHGPMITLSADGSLTAALDGRVPFVWRLDGKSTATRLDGLRCGTGPLDDACIQRLCERLALPTDEDGWKSLLGDDHRRLAAELQAARCAAQGPAVLPTVR